MNPLVHAELSWLMAQRLSRRRDRALVTAAGLIPDLDGLGLLWSLELYDRWHHVLFHGLVGAVVTSLAACALSHQRLWVTLLSAAAFHLHLGCDLLGSGPGWPIWYFWPWWDTEWFWDGQWDLGGWQNILIGAATTAVCLWVAVSKGRTPLELLSTRADAAVCATLQARLRPGGEAGPAAHSAEK